MENPDTPQMHSSPWISIPAPKTPFSASWFCRARLSYRRQYIYSLFIHIKSPSPACSMVIFNQQRHCKIILKYPIHTQTRRWTIKSTASDRIFHPIFFLLWNPLALPPILEYNTVSFQFRKEYGAAVSEVSGLTWIIPGTRSSWQLFIQISLQ